MTRPKALLTGSSGQVGSYLLRDLASIAEVTATQREALDLLDPVSIRDAVARTRPQWIVHPAAYTAVDRAESDRDTCFAVNAEATRTLAAEARRIGALLVNFSTDYVFNGEGEAPHTEDEPTGPLNVYGESKLQAERYLAESGCRYLNLRTSWVYSAHGHNFLKTMLRLGAEREVLLVVDDQHGAPTSAQDISSSVVTLLQSASVDDAPTGTFHLCGTGVTTWYGFAGCILDHARTLRPGQPWAHVSPVPSSHYPTPARRPQNSRLDSRRLGEVFGIALPPWQDSTRRTVAELLRASGGETD